MRKEVRLVSPWSGRLRAGRRATASTRTNKDVAVRDARFKLVFWHFLQPALYGLALGFYWSALSAESQQLGAIVAVREAIYLVTAAYMGWVHPAAPRA